MADEDDAVVSDPRAEPVRLSGASIDDTVSAAILRQSPYPLPLAPSDPGAADRHGLPPRACAFARRQADVNTPRRPDAADRSEHRRVHAVRWGVAVEEGLDVDDDLLAHIDAALERGGT